MGDASLRQRRGLDACAYSAIVLLIYVGLIGLTGFGFTRVPSGFVPVQDKGYLLVNMQLPDAASLERTVEVTEKAGKIARETPGVAHTATYAGQSVLLNAFASNYGTMFVVFKPFHERRDSALSGEAIAAQLRERFQREIPEARVLVFGAPAVRGLGNAGGFKLMVQATGDVDFDALQAQADNLVAKGSQQPGLVGLFNGFRARTPQLYVDIDRTKVKTMGVELNEVFDSLQAYLGSYYVNDFNRFGRTWQVNVQADARVPRGPGRSSGSSRSATPTARWCPWVPWPTCRTPPARSRSRGTTCFPRRRSTAPICPASAPATSWRRWRSWPRSCRLR